jgi:hypothetical protein
MIVKLWKNTLDNYFGPNQKKNSTFTEIDNLYLVTLHKKYTSRFQMSLQKMNIKYLIEFN